jgi:hypothetical protein
MWGAAWNIMQGWCSGDGFFYLQPVPGSAAWPADISLVRRMAQVGAPQLCRPVCLSKRHGEDGLDNALEAQGLPRICDAAPKDAPWNYEDPDQKNANLPRLSALLR